MNLEPITRLKTVDEATFDKEWRGRRPLIIEELASEWPATKTWTPEFFQEEHGDKQVPVIDPSYFGPGERYMDLDAVQLSMREYVRMVLEEKRDLRLFLYNLVEEIPGLVDQIPIPSLAKRVSKRAVFMFFGCQGSVTPLHYDLDMAELFHTQLHGEKRVLLFAPSESRRLYRYPFTVRSDVDLQKPDLERFPLVDQVNGLEATLKPGDTLYMPTGFWHYMVYEQGGYAVTLRCRPRGLAANLKAAYNILFMMSFDKLMNRVLGARWFNWKDRSRIPT